MDTLIQDFEVYNRAKNLSQSTISWYTRKLEDFWPSSDGDPLRVSPKMVREYLSEKMGGALKASTVKTYHSALSAFYSFLVADGLLDDSLNPMRRLSPPRVSQEPVEPLNEMQVVSLLHSFDTRRATGYRNYTICLLLLDSGLRANEAAGLRVDDVDWANHRLKVLGKGNKSRWVYIGQRVTKKLAEYLEGCRPSLNPSDGALFPSLTGHRLRSDAISKMVTRHLDRAGISRVGVSAHRLRHTFAVNFLRAGGGVFHLQRLLGHSTLTMTRRYVMLAEDDLAEAHRKASPIDNFGQTELLGEAA